MSFQICMKNKKIESICNVPICNHRFRFPRTMNATAEYKGFTINATDDAHLAHLKKTVDDFEKGRNQTPMDVDAARVARSCMGACNLLKPMTGDQARYLKEIARGMHTGSMVPVFAPNRIEARHFTRGSRVRNLVHGGMTGLLAVRLMNDSSQVERTSRTFNSLRVIERVNNEAGCSHVKWSIPEFQLRHNIGYKAFKKRNDPFHELEHEDAVAQFNALNTAEHREAFLAECHAIANRQNQSRVVEHFDENVNNNNECKWRVKKIQVANDEWIANLVGAFIKVCSTKMSDVNDSELDKLGRSRKLIELYRFIAQMDWIFTDPTVRFTLDMSRLYEAFIKRLFYFAKEGVEHSAYMLGRYAPEMMTPELHMCVATTHDLYRTPQLQIADDDETFGAMKVACDAFMPAAPAPVPVRWRRYSDEYSSDDYYYDSDGYGSDETDDTVPMAYNDDDDNDDDDNVNG